MIPLSDLRLMQVKVSPLRVLGDKIMAELQLAKRFDMLEGWRNAIAPAVGAGRFILWVADVRDESKPKWRHF